jgi:hypothetical protein
VSEFIVPRLGDKAKDIVTDFTGVVTAITTHLGGEITVTLQQEFAHGRTGRFPQARIAVTNPGWAVPSHLQVGG